MVRLGIAALALLVASSAANAQAKSDDTHAVRIQAKPELLRQAKVDADSARVIALAQVEGGTITSGHLTTEKSKGLVYEINLVAPRKAGIHKVQIDAMTGAVLNMKHQGGPVGVAKRAQQKTKHAQAKADSTSRAKP